MEYSSSNLFDLFLGILILLELKTVLLNFEFFVKVFLLCIFGFFSILLFAFLLLLKTVLLEDKGPLSFVLSIASFNFEQLFFVFSFSAVLFILFYFLILPLFSLLIFLLIVSRSSSPFI